MKIANNILELIGNTPLVRIQKLNAADMQMLLLNLNPSILSPV